MIDLDHNATTPLRPEVRAAMVDLLQRHDLGNPSSVHGRGRAAREVVESARRQVAGALHADPLEVTFVSGGTEADVLAVVGIASSLRRQGAPHGVLTSPLEHPAVTSAVDRLKALGHPVVWVHPDAQGRIDPAAVVDVLRAHPEVGLVSLATANHELGNLYDVSTIAAEVHDARPEVVVHTDAVQAAGKVPLHFDALGVDLLSISSHKLGGPVGAGALVHRKSARIDPLLPGHQERGRRAGTESWLSIAGFGRAIEAAVSELDHERARLHALRSSLLQGLQDLGARIHGDPKQHVGNTVNFGMPGCPGELMCMSLDLEGFAVSTGAACSAGTLEPSPVLLALGLSRQEASEAVRVSLGRTSTTEHVQALLEILPDIAHRIAAAHDQGRHAS